MVKFLNKILYRFGYALTKITKKEGINSSTKKKLRDASAKQKRISEWAKQYGYNFVSHGSVYSRMENNGCELSVYFFPLTVITKIKHPIKGETELRRSLGSFSEVEDVMRNPRVHLSRKSKYL